MPNYIVYVHTPAHTFGIQLNMFAAVSAYSNHPAAGITSTTNGVNTPPEGVLEAV